MRKIIKIVFVLVLINLIAKEINWNGVHFKIGETKVKVFEKLKYMYNNCKITLISSKNETDMFSISMKKAKNYEHIGFLIFESDKLISSSKTINEITYEYNDEFIIFLETFYDLLKKQNKSNFEIETSEYNDKNSQAAKFIKINLAENHSITITINKNYTNTWNTISLQEDYGNKR